ncbi:MAG: hypothetical protein KKB51_02530 [Candidatus Riflebacteria bacterium]|nr:hypothetical protein [Candidatus Riflebacteria bacterium]
MLTRQQFLKLCQRESAILNEMLEFGLAKGIIMKRMLFISIMLVMSSLLLHAAPKQDTDLFEEGDKLSYEGQLKRATDLLNAAAETPEKPEKAATDDGMDGTSLMLGILWGAIGTGFFIYGKKQSKAGYLICGIGLCLFPIFVTNLLYNTILGIILTIAPFKIEI